MARLARLAIIGTAIASLATAAFGRSDDLAPGMTAPKIDVKTWIKGTPVTDFEPGKTYVVEFWATWCGPCIQSIPHVTELAKKNKDVTFIGVGIWEDHVDQNVEKFVEKMGDKMDYNVAYSGNQDGMAVSWMKAAGQNGIPTAFIIKDTKIMWVGHPMTLDKPLEEIKAGTFDMEAFRADFDKKVAETKKRTEAYSKLNAITKKFDAGQRADAKTDLEALEKDYPAIAANAKSIRFDWLATEDPKGWTKQANEMAKSENDQQIGVLVSYAYAKAQKPETAAQAKKAIEIAIKGTKGKNFNVYMYAAETYKKLGDDKKTLEATNKLLELLPSSPLSTNAEYKDGLVKRKAELEAKLKKS